MNESTVVMNEYGGKQSHVKERFDLIPPLPLKVAAQVLAQGAEKYGSLNWTRITTPEHVNHALNHLNEFLLGEDLSEDHLAHALVRLMFAYHVDHYGVTINAAQPDKDPTNTAQPELTYQDLFGA